MALPVQIDDVRNLIDTAVDDSVITAMITTADIIVQEELVPQAIYSLQRLEEIEKWLAAHFLAAGIEMGGRITEEQEGGIRGDRLSYGGKLGDMLTMTRYGQQALVLDSDGYLQRLGKPAARIYVAKSSNIRARNRDRDIW